MSRCAGCDPILAAGCVRCRVCGVAGWPADAAWLPDGTILAVYPAACAHAGPGAWIVDLTALAPSTDRCNAIAAATGELCRNRARAGELRCWQHPAGGRVRPSGGA